MNLLTYTCYNCGFYLSESYVSFAYDSDSGNFYEIPMDNPPEDFKIKGYVLETFCRHCDKFVKTYLITHCENCEPEMAVDLVKQKISESLEVTLESKIDKLNEIRKRREFVIEKYNTFVRYYSAEFPREKFQYSYKDGLSDNEIEMDVIEKFDNLINRRISFVTEEHEKEHNKIHNVLDISTPDLKSQFWHFDFITCPECGEYTPKSIHDGGPCPKCGDKLMVIGAAILDVNPIDRDLPF